MHCKACDRPLNESDIFQLPNGEMNDLCYTCLRIVDEDLKQFDAKLPLDITIDPYLTTTLLYTKDEIGSEDDT